MTAVDEGAEQRQQTMQRRALRRLSACELAGLGLALTQLEVLEAELVEALPALRQAAEKEANVRTLRGLPPVGAYVRAWSGVKALLAVVSEAREETSYVEASGKVVKR